MVGARERAVLGVMWAVASGHELALDGSGTTNPSKYFWNVMALFEERAKPAVTMTYRAVGSSTGIFEFVGEENGYVPYNDFGSGDVPLGTEEYTNLTSKGIEVLHIPFALGAMSFFHNVPNAVGGLNMTGCVLADIFNRDITTWDDPAVMELNPLLSVPTGQEILVYHRVKGSSTTAGITTYLHASCPEKWPEDQVGNLIEWADGTLEAQGSGGMSAAISASEYTIGYIDSGHGHDDGLFEIELYNADGTLQDSLTASTRGGIQEAAAQALARDVIPSDPKADFSSVSLHNMPGQHTWPIVAISYIFVRADQTTTDYGALLKAYVDMVISEEGQDLLTTYNFVGVPASVLDVAKAASDAIELPSDATVWTFETADETQAGVGQADYVVSGKRRSYYEYAIGELQAETASSDDLTALSDLVASLSATVSELQSQKSSCDCDDDDDDDKKMNPAPIIVSALSILIALIAICIAVDARSKARTALGGSGFKSTEMSAPCGNPDKELAYADLGKQAEHGDI